MLGKLVNMYGNLNPPELGVVDGPFTVKPGNCLMQVPVSLLSSVSLVIMSDRCPRLGIGSSSPTLDLAFETGMH